MNAKKSSPTVFTRDFTLVVLGQIISLFGNAILRFALPLYLLRQTGSEALFGIVSASALLPMVVLSLLGGVLADRVNKRNIMVILDFCTAALVLAFTLVYQSVSLVPLFVVSLMLLYSINGIYQPAVQASIPALLPPEGVVPGNAVINQVSALAGLLGPIIGGLLLGSFGLGPILTVSIVCFFLSAVMEIFIHIPHTVRPTKGSAFSTVRADLGESIGYLRFQKPALLRVMLLAMLINLVLSAGLTIGLPIMITRTLALSDEMMGFCEAALGVGALLGGLFVGVYGAKLPVQKTALLLLAAAASLVPMALVLFLDAPVMLAYSVILLCCVVGMAAATATSIRILAHVQTETPAALVGKVVSCLIAGSLCAQPVGQVLYGLLFSALPAWLVMAGAAAVSMLVCLYARRVLQAAAPQTETAPK